MKKKAGALAGVFALAGLVALFSFGPSSPALAAPPEGEQPNADPTGSPAEGHNGHKVTTCHNGHPIEVDVHAQLAHAQNHGDDVVVGGVVGGTDVAEPARQGEEQGDAEVVCGSATQEEPRASQAPSDEVRPEGDQPEETTQQEQYRGSEADATGGTQLVEGDEPAEEEIREPSQSGGTETVEDCDGESMELEPEEERALELHNEARERHSLEPLCADPQLTRAARSHSEDMIQKRYFSHASPSGETLGARLERSGYEHRTAGENIAWGTGPHATPEDAFERWMGSPGHRENVLDGGFEEVGVGAATGDLGETGGHAATMYTVDFATPADAKRTGASSIRAKEARAAEEIEGG
jgi:uncharacterized protein YkwD